MALGFENPSMLPEKKTVKIGVGSGPAGLPAAPVFEQS